MCPLVGRLQTLLTWTQLKRLTFHEFRQNDEVTGKYVSGDLPVSGRVPEHYCDTLE